MTGIHGPFRAARRLEQQHDADDRDGDIGDVGRPGRSAISL